MHTGLHWWNEGLFLGSNSATVALCYLQWIEFYAQNLCFCVGLKCILKVVFNAVNLAYPKVNVSYLCEALLHTEYACESSSSST